MANTHDNSRTHDSAILAARAAQVQRGGARAAVLGVNDGLVSVLCIVLGVAGAHAKASAVLLAGFAGLIAGAISMAAGEWISVTSQVELFNGVLNDIRHLVKHDKDLLVERLAQDYENGGQTKATAMKASKEIAKDSKHLFNEFTNNVIGINPAELGSPWTAALSSLALFTLGALAALVPWFFTKGQLAIYLSVIFTAAGGLIVGGYVSRSSGNNIYRGAIRQLLIIIFASVITFGIGHLFGSAIGA
ncbi:MAG TPA: VIT1/CCC1 transporter family protein [Candidatus Saccharimonadales bacterium]|nr:VIT1/CCC1 transporter family protein [Candidatus Saccharimonadales bacterium]